jgi:hypothetical protein
MSDFSRSLWSYLIQRRSLTTSQFEEAFGALMHLLPYDDNYVYDEFRSARNILRLWHSSGWIEYDYESQRVLPRPPKLISYLEGDRESVALVAVDEVQADAFAVKFGATYRQVRLDTKISELYPPIYQTDLKPGMTPDIRSERLLAVTPGKDDILSLNSVAPLANVHIVNRLPRLVDLQGRKEFHYDTLTLDFKEGESAAAGNFLIRYQSSYNFKTDLIWRHLSSSVHVTKQFRVIEEWAWGMHIALAESILPPTVMYDPVARVFATYMKVPLPRSISRLLAWHGGRPPGFRPNWNDPLRGGRHSLYLYHNVSHSMALAVAAKLGHRADKKPLRLVVL